MTTTSYMVGTTANLSIHNATSLSITKRLEINKRTGKPYKVINIKCGNNGCDVLTDDISIFMDADIPVNVEQGVLDNE